MSSLIDKRLLDDRKEKLAFYSPYYFLRQLPVEKNYGFGIGQAEKYTEGLGHQLFEFIEGEDNVQFLYNKLDWDTEFFGTQFYKLFTVLFKQQLSIAVLEQATVAFKSHLQQLGAFYIFTELPAQDTILAQVLGRVNWRLVETRLTYFHDNVNTFEYPRFPVRAAQLAESAVVGQVAAAARNEYDRFHADPWFTPDLGDAFLTRYATAAVEGYCDEVLVPAEPDLPLNSFLAISDLKDHASVLGVGLSRVMLTAVGPLNRGWHLKLTAETLQRAKVNGASYVLMTTQATNHAVFRTCEKLGFKLGSCSHIFALSNS